jgi:hypothetical protein
LAIYPRLVDPDWTKAEEETARDYLKRIAGRLKDSALAVHARVRLNPSVPVRMATSRVLRRLMEEFGELI